MRYAVILAGGSGTRLWPMSREQQPKQLLPFINGQSLLQLASDRLEGLVPAAQRYVCAADTYRAAIEAALPLFAGDHFLGEPAGRDTLNAIGLSAAVIGARDPAAVIAVFPADQVIEPFDAFRRIIDTGYRVVESAPHTLVTFGITPYGPSTGYGYLQLGAAVGETARVVEQFKEKPDATTAASYVAAGPERYLWNSGMFVWRASTLLDCIRRYEPAVHGGLMTIAAAWHTPRRAAVLAEVFPQLKKISIDFAVMEPAARDPQVRVAAVPMPLRWLDVGSWPSFAQTCPRDEAGNALGGGQHLLVRTRGTLVASSDPHHLLTVIGGDDLIVIHTADATLVCRAADAERIKEVQQEVAKRFGRERV